MSDEVDFSEDSDLMIDLSEVEESAGFELVPRGVYAAVVAECEATHSQAGNPMWSLQYEITEGDYAGRKMFSHMVWAGAGLGITKKHLSRVHPELTERKFNPFDDDIVAEMLGRECQLKVNVKKYQGEDRNNVADLLAPRDGGGDFD